MNTVDDRYALQGRHTPRLPCGGRGILATPPNSGNSDFQAGASQCRRKCALPAGAMSVIDAGGVTGSPAKSLSCLTAIPVAIKVIMLTGSPILPSRRSLTQLLASCFATIRLLAHARVVLDFRGSGGVRRFRRMRSQVMKKLATIAHQRRGKDGVD
jgi:hypothetical protein